MTVFTAACVQMSATPVVEADTADTQERQRRPLGLLDRRAPTYSLFRTD